MFELALIRMSRYYDISSQTVLFDETLLPMEAFLTTRDTTEMKLVTEVFHFARDLAEMQLSEVALSLYSAYILLQEGEKLRKHYYPTKIKSFSLDPDVKILNLQGRCKFGKD